VGYFSFNGNLDTCITIRTALLKDGKAGTKPLYRMRRSRKDSGERLQLPDWSSLGKGGKVSKIFG
jgi:hypothetical protein